MMVSDFQIYAANKTPALEAARAVHGRWVKPGDCADCATLEELLGRWGYEAHTNEQGDIVGLDLTNESLGAEFDLFKVIAPFVQASSFLHMNSDFGEFRWVFDGTTCAEVKPTW